MACNAGLLVSSLNLTTTFLNGTLRTLNLSTSSVTTSMFEGKSLMSCIAGLLVSSLNLTKTFLNVTLRTWNLSKSDFSC